jgi:hypothetical protein
LSADTSTIGILAICISSVWLLIYLNLTRTHFFTYRNDELSEVSRIIMRIAIAMMIMHRQFDSIA